MLSFLKIRALLIVLGFVLVALFVWFAGPYFAFAEYRPLESVTARLVLIGLIVAVWLASVLFKRLRANRASDNLVAAVVKQSRADERPSADAQALRERFEEATALLRDKRRSGHSLYELPWYVIIGAPGSGKTTALINSGLNFPLEQRSGKGALRGVGGTRNCDWWFTDEAVFLDTAGRYTTQDSDAAADSAGWAEFLGLLRKYRKRRPLNGVILTINAHDLLTQGEAGREAHVAAARRRLGELNKELRIQLPIYLMVTKCDLVAGFTEYFDDLTQEGRAQVWGVTFPYEQTRRGETAQTFPAEFDALIARLNSRLFSRLEEERDLKRRAKLFAFPQQMSVLRDSLAGFVRDVFASTRFDQPVYLRGVYFTSGTQEGTPIDRLLGAIGRRFAVAPEAVIAPGGRGKAYFIERLLKEVLLAESGLAGVNRRLEVQKAVFEIAAYVALALVAILGVIVFSISYSRNRAYIADVAASISALRDVPKGTSGTSFETLLPRLDAVRAVDDSANRYRNSTPWEMRWGLYQGGSVGDAARDAYGRELDGAMLPYVADRFKRRLLEYAPEPEKLYPYLKGYLMLGHPEHLDKQQLAYLGDLEWQSAYADDPDRAASVAKHFRSLLDYQDSLRPIALDEAIIAQARSTLQQASQAGLVYRYVRISYANDTARSLRLDLAAGLGAERVLKRRSRVSLSQPVPSIYTKPVFEEITKRGTDAIVKQFTDEYWVWGDARPSIAGSARLSAEFLDVYEKDYIAAWDAIVNDIQAAPLSSLDDTKEALAILSGSTSPLRGLLKVVDDNTYLVKPAEPPKPGLIPGVGGALGNLFDAGKKIAGVPSATTTPGRQITSHFEPIHRLLAGDQGSAPIDVILGKLRELQQKMQPIALQDVVGGTSPGNPQSIASVGQTATELKRDAAPLPPGIGSVVTQVANGATAAVRGGVRNDLQSRFQQDVAKQCAAIVANRYPFVSQSPTDVPLADFGRLFGYGGVYEMFFKTELADLVDTSANPWRWRTDATGNAVGGSVSMLRQFEAADTIREMFFRPGSQMPEVRFTVTPVELDASATRFVLELDGQTFDYRHGPPRPLAAVWPGPNPGMAAASFEDRSGARPNIVSQGAWAWFRLIDAGQMQREVENSRTRYVLTFEKGGHQAKLTIEAPSILNPFVKRDLQQFSCGI
jgi:type VI secretion system protein ImpL